MTAPCVNVCLYSPYWVMVSALEALCLQQRTDRVVAGFYTTSHLLTYVVALQPQFIVMALRPHEHIVLLQALRLRSPSSILIIVSYGFYYSDQMIARFLGRIVLVTNDEVMAGAPEYSPLDWATHPALSQLQSTYSPPYLPPACLLNEINEYMKRSLVLYGVGPRAIDISLRGFAWGKSVRWMSCQLNMSPKTVYVHRDNMTRRLNIHSCAYSREWVLMRSLRVSQEWQYQG